MLFQKCKTINFVGKRWIAFVLSLITLLFIPHVAFGLEEFFGQSLIHPISTFFFNVAGWFLGLVGSLFEESIKFSFDSANYELPGVLAAWEILRDLANLVFIFILLYIATAFILSLGGDMKRALVTLLIVALLINFSFFLTGVVIDAGNILTGFIYESITPDNTPIAEEFRTRLKVTSTSNLAPPIDFNIPAQIVVNIMGGIVMLIAAFVFLAGAFLFVVRTVTLMIILVTAPVAFAAAILPKTSGVWSEWFGKLVSNAFVSVVFLLLIAVALLISDPDSFLVGAKNQSFSHAFNLNNSENSVNSIQVVLNYILIIALLIGALTLSHRMASETANRAKNLMNRSIKYGRVGAGLGVRGTAATTGFAGRRLGGRLSRNIRESERVKNMATSDNRFVRFAGKQIEGVAHKGATGSWDIRKAPGVSSGLGALGVKAGKGGGKGGYEKIRAGQVKNRTDQAERISRVTRTRTEQAELNQDYEELNRLRDQLNETGNAAERKRLESQIKGTTDAIKRREAYINRRGQSRKEKVAEHLDKRGIISTILAQTAANRQGSLAIRKGKSDNEKVIDAIKNIPSGGGGGGGDNET